MDYTRPDLKKGPIVFDNNFIKLLLYAKQQIELVELAEKKKKIPHAPDINFVYDFLHSIYLINDSELAKTIVECMKLRENKKFFGSEETQIVKLTQLKKNISETKKNKAIKITIK